MSVLSLFESSVFKVESPREFLKETKEFIGGEFILSTSDEGFSFKGENVHDLRNFEDGFSGVVKILQKYLPEGGKIRVLNVWIDQNQNEISAEFHIITNIAHNTLNTEDCFEKIEFSLFPRKVTALYTVQNHITKEWIEKGHSYKVLAEDKKGPKNTFIVEHESGKSAQWAKGYFYEQ